MCALYFISWQLQRGKKSSIFSVELQLYCIGVAKPKNKSAITRKQIGEIIPVYRMIGSIHEAYG